MNSICTVTVSKGKISHKRGHFRRKVVRQWIYGEGRPAELVVFYDMVGRELRPYLRLRGVDRRIRMPGRSSVTDASTVGINRVPPFLLHYKLNHKVC